MAGHLPIEGIRDHGRRYYAFESAFPRIDGLREHYGVDEGLTFWEVHERLDVEHADAERATHAEASPVRPQVAIIATRS